MQLDESLVTLKKDNDPILRSLKTEESLKLIQDAWKCQRCIMEEYAVSFRSKLHVHCSAQMSTGNLTLLYGNVWYV